MIVLVPTEQRKKNQNRKIWCEEDLRQMIIKIKYIFFPRELNNLLFTYTFSASPKVNYDHP